MRTIRIVVCKKCGRTHRLTSKTGNFGKFKCTKCGHDKCEVKSTYSGI